MIDWALFEAWVYQQAWFRLLDEFQTLIVGLVALAHGAFVFWVGRRKDE